MPNVRVNVEVNDPILRNPTVKQMSATLWSVARKQRSRPLQSACQQVLVGWFAERLPELTAEVRG